MRCVTKSRDDFSDSAANATPSELTHGRPSLVQLRFCRRSWKMRRRRANVVLLALVVGIAWFAFAQFYGFGVLFGEGGVSADAGKAKTGARRGAGGRRSADKGAVAADVEGDTEGPSSGSRALAPGSLLRLGTLPLDKGGQHRILHAYAAPSDAAGAPRDASMGSDDASYYAAPMGVDIATHATANHLHSLVDLARRWDGEISVAVFDPAVSPGTLALIDGLRACNERIAQRVHFHVVYPRDATVRRKTVRLLRSKRRAEAGVPTAPLSDDACKAWAEVYGARILAGEAPPDEQEELEGLGAIDEEAAPAVRRADADNYALDFPYPNNLLRNVARGGTRSAFVLVLDIDILPAPHLRDDFLTVLRHASRAGGGAAGGDDIDRSRFVRSLFVVPAFEKVAWSAFPEDYEAVAAGLREGTVRPFYNATCWKCQQHTDYSLWLEESADPGALFYTRPWKDPWEPFYIGPRSAPPFDERFRQYGFNRISQVCEAWVAGFDFKVLVRAFLVHNGFKEAGAFHLSKDRENDANRLLFRAMKQELKSRYPLSKRRCY